jgi:hypothetical protein
MSTSSIVSDIMAFTQQYSFYTCIVIFVLGIIGNTLNIFVFTRLKLFRHNRCANYLVVELIIDIVYLIAYFTSTIFPTIYGYDPSGSSLVWCRLRTVVIQTCTLISLCTVCFIACDQLCSTTYQLHLRQICTVKLARWLTIVTCCISLLHSIIFALFSDISPFVGCVISNPVFTQYSTFFYIPVLGGLLPILVSSLFSILAFRGVRRIVRHQVPIVRRRLDRQMTVMVLMRVVFFVIFRLPFVIYRIYAINNDTPSTNVLSFAIKRLIQATFNSFVSLNYAV